jgi:hypothetical protein
VLTRYRVWDDQEVASDSYVRDKPSAFAVVEALVNAQRRRHRRTPVRRPSAGPAHGRSAVRPGPQP